MAIKNTLKFYIAKMFFIVIFLLSILLIGLNYRNSTQLNEKIARERINHSIQEVTLAYQKLTLPVHTLLNALSASRLQDSPKAMLDSSLLQSIASVLNDNPIMLSVYVGYQNDQSVFLRSLKNNAIKQHYNAPLNADLQLDIYQASGKELTRYYFDSAFNLISITRIQQEFKPTTRLWYANAKLKNEIVISPPYKYQFSGIYGITYSKKLSNNLGVIAVDITLDSLNQFITKLNIFSLYHGVNLFILDENKNIFAKKSTAFTKGKHVKQSLATTVMQMEHINSSEDLESKFTYENSAWWLTTRMISKDDPSQLKLITAIPEKALVKDAIEALQNQIAYALIGLFCGWLLAFYIAEKLVTPLKKFTHLANKFSSLNFKGVKIPESNISEIKELAKAFSTVANTIDSFLVTLTLISSTKNLDALLQNIVAQCKQTAQADFALLWTEQENDQIKLSALNPEQTHAACIDYHSLIQDLPKLEQSLLNNQPFLFSPQKSLFTHCQFPKEVKRAWVIPMVNRQSNYMGCIMLGFYQPLKKEQESKVHFLHAFLGFISLLHENWAHIHAQKKLFLSLIEMMASAIDAKSPYTGGHCQRVPELSLMLAKATDLDTKYHPNFKLNEESREALHLAAWLHDCGKVTTPEYVIDKATKLETLHNRIHEIRTRFEVIKRDKEIQYLKEVQAKTQSKQELNKWLVKELKTLDEEFAFIAQMNLGEHVVTEQDLTKLQSIAARTWQRTLNDDIGISWEEKHRLKIKTAIPCTEYLLKDAAEQEIPWPERQKQQFKDWPFNLLLPSLQFNRGELYNLSIAKGTLTEEERFIINNHIVQTINMLNKLPYPEHLSRIPEIAGGHHERMDGKGYPMGLNKSNFPIDARIIAVADIFEALTATDRPYKTLKTVNESLCILAKMAKEGHIDKGLFRIFVERKVYLTYAKAFLSKEQCDKVDEKAIFALLD